MKRALLYIAIFFVLGELVLRFDAATLFFQGARFEELDRNPVPSEVRTALEEGRFETGDGQLRILLLGDSILYRRALAPDKAFAGVLEDRLQAGRLGEGREVLVLDLLTPGVGPIQLRDRYLRFADDFRPHVVFWAYNRSDIHQVELREPVGSVTIDASNKPDLDWRERLQLGVIFFKKRITKDFKVASFVNRNLTDELKARGIVLPGSRFEFMLKRSHHPDYVLWQRTREIFGEVEQRCREQNTYLLVMLTPLLNIMPYYDLVSEMDRDVEAAFRELGADFLNGATPFLSDPAGDYAVSRYDEHPNAKAHGIMAETVAEHLNARIHIGPDGQRTDSLPAAR